MRRIQLCDLAGVPLETVKNWTRPDRASLLPFGVEMNAEGAREREFSETHALMLAAAYEAGRGAPSQAQVAQTLNRCWQHIAKRGRDIGAASPDIFAAIVTAQDAAARECVGLIVGSLDEVAAAFASLPKALEAGSAEYSGRSFLLRNCFYDWESGASVRAPLEPTGVALANLSRALHRIVERAGPNGVDLSRGFLRAYGVSASDAE
jgi:hypothetical protein